MALIALGGYGRGELNPYSDIDFMFLHDGQVVAGSKALPHLSKLMDGILYPLWDLGFKIGHSVRTIAECVQVANQDMQSKTSLIESRLVAGEQKLFEKFGKTLIAKCVEGFEEEYIDARIQDQAAAAIRVRDTALNGQRHVGAQRRKPVTADHRPAADDEAGERPLAFNITILSHLAKHVVQLLPQPPLFSEFVS